MKMGVETPDRLVDVTRLDLAKVEELPDGKGVRVGALVRNSDLAEQSAHPGALPRVESGAPGRGQPAASQHGDHRRQPAPAHALLLLLRSRLYPVQQAPTRQRVWRAGGLQPHPRHPRPERPVHRHAPERHVRGDGRAGRRRARAGAQGRTADSPSRSSTACPATIRRRTRTSIRTRSSPPSICPPRLGPRVRTISRCATARATPSRS